MQDNEAKVKNWLEQLSLFLLEEHSLDARKFLAPENFHRIFNCN